MFTSVVPPIRVLFLGPLGGCLALVQRSSSGELQEMLALVETAVLKIWRKKVTSERHKVWNCRGFGAVQS